MDCLTVAIWSTDPLTVPGLASVLRARPELHAVPLHGVGDAQAALVAAESITADVCAALDRIAAASSARVVLLTNELTDADLRLAARCGVVSVLPRSVVTTNQLLAAVMSALRTPTPDPAERTARLTGQLERVQRGLLRPRGLGCTPLAPRERDLLRLLADGLDTAEIAHQLAYSERTVKNIVQGLMSRLGLKNRTHAVAFAMRSGVL
ncbi:MULTISPECIES: helix-turn-helix transcriptional regulator [Amycolatopsis]|uniref:Response regulator transcription factor n=1 Tax=Amycolatopsis albidoflavus TaxID=102226 RepID=A0ABW5I9D6_9PSEU